MQNEALGTRPACVTLLQRTKGTMSEPTTLATVILPALFGACFQEALRWVPLVNRRPTAAEKEQIRSGYYWIPALLLVSGGTIGTYYFTLGGPSSPLHCVAIGAAFPSLFKKVVDAVAGMYDRQPMLEGGDRTPKMGSSSEALSVLRDFFR